MARLGHSYAHLFASTRRGLDAITRGATVTDRRPCKTRKRWRRQANGVAVRAEFVCRPKDVCEVIKIIEWAEDNDRTVRAVGVGHSFSDVVDTTGIIVDMSKISGVVIDDLKTDERGKQYALVTVRAGTSIKALNTALRKCKTPKYKTPLALEIMGSYDAQHIAGAVSTGTHGSGRTFGPIESQVVALKIVTAGGQEHTLQRAATDWQERQEFLATVVSMGCAGIITEMTLRVVPSYKLFEERLLQDWVDIREEIKNGSFHKDWDHAEAAVYQYPVAKEEARMCVVTKRRRPTKEDLASNPPDHRTGWSSRLAGLSKLLKPILAWKMGNPKEAAKLSRSTLKGLAHKGYLHRSDKVLQLGAENEAVKISEGIEYMFHVTDQSGIDHVLNVVDKLVKLGECRYKAEKPFLSSPILMRFVGCSEALVAPQWGVSEEDYVVTLEMGVIESINGAREILKDCEDLMVCEGGRPHWGLNFNHYSRTDIKKAYGSRFEEWKKIVREFNKSGVFNNALTERLGI